MAGPGDRYAGVSDGELDGAIAAWDRIEAHAAARKHAAVAEYIRRRPDKDGASAGPEAMPEMWDEFAADELRLLLADSAAAAEHLMSRARDLADRLPVTMAAFRAGRLRQDKVAIIVGGTGALGLEESAVAEKLVLGRAGRLTPSGLRAAVAQAVLEVAPDLARHHREQALQDARVERWAEDSGNAALIGRELPPDEVLAADQRISAWARELRQAGLKGDMDVLRARAYLDLLLDIDSRPAADAGQAAADSGEAGAGGGNGEGGTGGPGSESRGDSGPDGGPGGDGPGGGPGGGGPAGSRPPSPGGAARGRGRPGFAGRVNLTVPLATARGLADRPGQLAGTGPIDPWLARDLLTAAAQNPKTAWCVTFTDADGHAAWHGCGRPAPKTRAGPGKREKPGSIPDSRDGPGFSFTPEQEQDGAPGGYRTWRLRTPGDGPDYLIDLYSLSTEDCDHRFEATGHDPGKMLRHLTQIRYATCTGPVCRRPANHSDFEHSTPYDQGGKTCLCNADPQRQR